MKLYVQEGQTVNGKINIQVLAFFAALASLPLPIQAATQGKAISPTLLLLLFGKHSCEIDSQQTVIWQGLEWQRCDDGLMYDWDQATAYCQELVLQSKSDWRLPTKDELKSLVVCNNGITIPLQDYPNDPYYCGGTTYDTSYARPTIDSVFQSSSKFYWSSSTYYDAYKWGVYFFSGYTDWEHDTYENHVRCVR